MLTRKHKILSIFCKKDRKMCLSNGTRVCPMALAPRSDKASVATVSGYNFVGYILMFML